MTSFVLVHGAWHGGWCWRRTADCLRAAGHLVFTPTLTGLGERAHLLSPGVDLSTHVADVIGCIEAEEIDHLVLCGHSYGGAVSTLVADRITPRLATLVLLDGYIAANGLSLLDADPPDRRERILQSVVHGPNGDVLPPAPAVVYALGSEADQQWVDRRCTPHPLATFTETARLGDHWQQVPRLAYVATTRFQPNDFRDIAARLSANPRFTCASIESGHDAMIDAPQTLSNMLSQFAE